MDTKLYLTIAGIIAILYGIGFLLIPEQLNVLLGGLSEPHVIYAQRVFAGAALAWGLILWFARDFRDWDAVRGVLIGSSKGRRTTVRATRKPGSSRMERIPRSTKALRRSRSA